MMRVKSCLGPSKIHGVGCFACEDVPKGGLVWEFDHGLDREITIKEVAQLPRATREFLKTHSWASPNKTVLICNDHGGYFNHAEKANTRMSADGYQCIATCNIKKGVEFTTNYKELPDIETAEGGPQRPRFKSVSNGPLGGVGIHLASHSNKMVWTIPVVHIKERKEADRIVDTLNHLLDTKIIQIEKPTLGSNSEQKDYTIAPLSQSNVPYLARILASRWGISEQKAHDEAQRYAAGAKEALGFVVETDNKIIGVCLLDHHNEDVDPRNGPWTLGLWVEPNYRGEGLGQQLMEACENEARKQGFKQIFLDTTDAEKYHLRYGWKAIGSADYHGETTVIMQKTL